MSGHRHEFLTSPQNPRVKEWAALQKDGRLRRERGEFLVEGRRLVETALDLGLVRTFIYSEKLADEAAPLLARAEALGAECVELSMVAFRKLADVPSPQGLAAVAPMPEAKPEDLFGPDAFLLVACGVQEPGNLGSMLRSALAAGATGLVALPPSADLTHPRSVRGSAGAVMSLPSARMETADFVAACKGSGIEIWTAMPRDGRDYRHAEFKRPLALAVGSEAHGVPEEVSLMARGVTVPMAGGLESLNAASAATLLLYRAAEAMGAI